MAISHQSEWIVVNTHDLVLVACRNAQEFKTGLRSLRRADFETRLLTHTWGLHYSALQFSPDGSWLAVEHDGSSILFNMHDLAWRERAIRPPFAWHPQKPNLLGFDKQGRILWMDITQESPLPEVLCALEYDSVTANIAGLWMHPSGESCVTVYRHGHWVWWQLKPFQLLSQGMIDDSECGRVCGTPGVPWMAVQTENAIWIGDLDDRQLWSWTKLPSTTEARFSPSGRRMVTLSQIRSSNPYPAHPAPTHKRTATMWEVTPNT